MRGEIYKQVQIKAFIYRVLQCGGFDLFLMKRRLFLLFLLFMLLFC